MFEWIGFDADDTLWRNEEYYLEVREKLSLILEKYDLGNVDSQQMDELEVENIQYYGYGVMSFVLSLIEQVIQVTNERIHPADILALLNSAKEMLSANVELYDGVHNILKEISTRYSLLLITKGDLFHQQRKIKASGLEDYFQAIEVVSEKDSQTYLDIFDHHQISVKKFLMIGNSLRSDILPILDLGGWAIHLARHVTWSHEDDPGLGVIPSQRYLEVESIDQILNALDQLERKLA
jgi:putative hydrolase of the HAD superfamily